MPRSPVVAHPSLVLFGLLMLASPAPSRADEVPWPSGRWRVAPGGWAPGERLARLEIVAERGGRRARLLAFDAAAEGGPERAWPPARIDLPGATLAPSRWLRAEWSDGPTAVLMMLRPAPGGRLVAVVRRRDREQRTPERVGQLCFEPEPPEGAPPSPPADAPAGVEAAGLFTVRPDGSELRRVAGPEGFARACDPAWSPDGLWLAFTAFDATGRDPLILVVSARGGPTLAVAAGITPSWSRDGTRLAYVASGKPEFARDWDEPGRNDERIEAVRLAGPDAGTRVVLARGLGPRWSPADDRLAFSARRDANWDVFLLGADGLTLLRLTDDPALDTHPTWTDAGRSIVFLSNRANRWDLYRAPADGRGPAVRLTDHPRREEGAELDPTGRWAAFTDRAGRPDSRILLLDLPRAEARLLLDPSVGDRDPAWSPDGATLAFSSRRPAPPDANP